MKHLTLAFLQNIGYPELLVILALGVLLFGKRLPEVGRSLGKGIVEFKRGLKDVNRDIETQSSQPETSPKAIADDPSPSLPQADARRVSQTDVVENTQSNPPSHG